MSPAMPAPIMAIEGVLLGSMAYYSSRRRIWMTLTGNGTFGLVVQVRLGFCRGLKRFHKKAHAGVGFFMEYGPPDRIRTYDLCLRRPTQYITSIEINWPAMV